MGSINLDCISKTANGAELRVLYFCLSKYDQTIESLDNKLSNMIPGFYDQPSFALAFAQNSEPLIRHKLSVRFL